ncbi:MAG: PEP-CTERM sorting domain-containing protein [Roseateles sp.]
MRAKSKLLALGLAAVLQPAVAGVVNLGFEQPADWGKLSNQFVAQGVTFSGDAWAVGSAIDDCDGSVLFSKAGSCGALLLGNPSLAATSQTKSLTINLTGGFIQQFDFVFGQVAGASVAIKVFEGLDGSGAQLGIAAALNGGGCSEPSLRFCGDVWPAGYVKFDGVARSVVISGIDQRLMLDDLQFITPAASNRLPEPASVGLALSALGALGWVRRRRDAR